jgi:hypothetical protein
LAIIAQAILASLLASAMAATLVGRPRADAEYREFWHTASAPAVNGLRK